MARGVDLSGKAWAESKAYRNGDASGLEAYGKRAGFLRNLEMSKYGEALIAIWDSKATEQIA